MDKKIIFLIVIVLFSFLFHFYSQGPYLNYNDAAIYAGIAGNLRQGKGLTTDFIYPEYFRYTSRAKTDVWSSYWLPLHPLFLAAGFFLFGISDRTVMYVTSVLFLISVWLVYLLARRIFNKDAAFFSTLFYACTQEMLWYSTSGLSEPLLICFLLFCLFFLYGAGKKITFFVAGLCLGLAAMTRNAALIYIPSLVFFTYFSQPKGKKIISNVFFLTGIFLIIFSFRKIFIPLLGADYSFKNTLWNPFFFNTQILPGGEVMRTLDNVDFSFTLQHFPFILKKILPNLKMFFESMLYFNIKFNTWNWIFTLMHPFLVILYILSLFRPPSEEKQRLLHFALILLFLTVLIFNLFTITTPEMRYFHLFVPLLIIFAVSALIRIFNKLTLNSGSKRMYLNLLVTALIVLFLLPEMAKNYFYHKERYKFNPKGYYQIMGEVLEKYTQPQDIVVTNLDGWGSWYGKRRTIYYPIKPQDLKKLNNYTRIDALLIFKDLFFDQGDRSKWSSLIDNPKDFTGFRFVKIINIYPNKKEVIQAVLYRKE